MDPRLTVSINAPKVENLSKPQRHFLEALSERIERAGFRVLPDSATNDSVEYRLNKIRRSHGVVVWACAQWKAERLFRAQDRTLVLPTEFSHIAAVMAVAARRPLLVLREKTVAERGAFRGGYVRHVVKVPSSLRSDWLDDPEFNAEFDRWTGEVQCFRHVFLGYSSKAKPVADKIHKFLSQNLKLRVFDWHDFSKGETIWDSIERAERYTSCGIFLFMADDEFAVSRKNNDRQTGGKKEYAPRDNVVYEAGFFAGAKGRREALVIREKGAKMPSDLGGILYLNLTNKSDVASLETPLREYLEKVLDDRIEAEP